LIINTFYFFFYSVVFITIPIIFNTMLAFGILIFEVSNNAEFLKWMKAYSQLAAIITFLSGSDIAGLLLLSSNFAGLKLFSAQFSIKAKNYIYWGIIVNLIIEDIPQLCIQVCLICFFYFFFF